MSAGREASYHECRGGRDAADSSNFTTYLSALLSDRLASLYCPPVQNPIDCQDSPQS